MDIEDALKRLRLDYALDLPRRLKEISRLWCALKKECKGRPIAGEELSGGDPHGCDLSQQLQIQIHSLSESAASFGFSRLGEHARQLEGGIKPLLQEKRPANDQEIRFFQEGLKQLEQLTALGPEQESEQENSPAQPDHGKRQRHVVVVADDAAMTAEMGHHLRQFGYGVSFFVNTQQASKVLASLEPDALVMDRALTHDLRAEYEKLLSIRNLANLSLPIIFLSEHDNWNTRLKAVRSGAQAYLTKPLDYGLLVDRLDCLTLREERENYRILLVEDVPQLAEHYALMLRRAEMQVRVLMQPDKILEQIAEFQPELILMSLYMPGCSGFEAAQVLRQHPDTLGIPIVFLSTEEDRDIQISLLQQGDDFLLKPIMEEELVRTTRARVQRARALGDLMYYDRLTSLLNHTTLKLKLENEWLISQRKKSPFTYVMLDIDHFKQVNDQFGHPAGDHVLRSLGRLLKERLRGSDQVGRYGGEEFGVILPDISTSEAADIINELREQFAAIVHRVGGKAISCTFSAGLSSSSCHCNTTELIKATDVALYRAKDQGRNRIVIDEPDSLTH
jgi:diguanylate cyclase (GGDEF)-like protein